MKFLQFSGWFILEWSLSMHKSTTAADVARQPKIIGNADHWWFQVNTCNQCWKELKKIHLQEMATLREINFIHSVYHIFPTDLQWSSPCQHHSSYMSVISSYNLTALTPAFSLLKLLPSGTAVLYFSNLIHLSSLCKSQLKTFIFSIAPISISFVLSTSIKQSRTWLRIRLVRKMLQTVSSLQR